METIYTNIDVRLTLDTQEEIYFGAPVKIIFNSRAKMYSECPIVYTTKETLTITGVHVEIPEELNILTDPLTKWFSMYGAQLPIHIRAGDDITFEFTEELILAIGL